MKNARTLRWLVMLGGILSASLWLEPSVSQAIVGQASPVIASSALEVTLPYTTQRMAIDLTTNGKRNLVSEDGRTTIGYYLVYRFRDRQGTTWFILLISEFVNPKEPYAGEYADFYLGSDNGTPRHLFTSRGRDYQIANDVTSYQVLAKFFYGPLTFLEIFDSIFSLTSLDQRLGPDEPFIDSSPHFKGTFIPLVIERLLELLQQPGIQFESDDLNGLLQHLRQVGGYDNYAGPSRKGQIIAQLARAWEHLSVEAKGVWLANVATGNAATITDLGSLILRYINDLSTAYPDVTDPKRISAVRYLLPACAAVVWRFDVPVELRNAILSGTLGQLQAVPAFTEAHAEYPLNFLYDVLVRTNGLVVTRPEDRTMVSHVVNRVLANRQEPFITEFIMNNLSSYVDATGLQRVQERLTSWIAQYDGSASRLGVLVQTATWPIGKEQQTTIEALILTSKFQQWQLSDIAAFAQGVLSPTQYAIGSYFNWHGSHVTGFTNRGVWNRSIRHLSPAAQDTLLQQLAARLATLDVPPHSLGGVGQVDAYRGVLSLLDSADSPERYVTYFSPVLKKLNPRQVGESDASYRQRIANVESLFAKGVLVSDFRGTTIQFPAFFEVLRDFVKTHPDWVLWVDVAEVTGGDVDLIRIESKRMASPPDMAFAFNHEGGHAYHFSDRRAPRTFEFLASYWFQNGDPFQDADYVSGYAKTHVNEYAAEFLAYWYGSRRQDASTRSQLATALTNYQDGHPAMLNMFLLIWGLAKPLDTPAERVLPLFTLQDNGLLHREWIPGGWDSGDMRLGTFSFRLDGIPYEVDYRDYRIVGIKGPWPYAPKGLLADGFSVSRSIRLTWQDAAGNEDGFYLERATSPNGPFSRIATLPANATTHVDAGLQPGTTYDYRLRAYNAAGQSAWVGPVAATALLKGDANLSGTVTTLDIVFMRRHMLGISSLSERGLKNAAAMAQPYDQLTLLDIIMLRRCILYGSCN